MERSSETESRAKDHGYMGAASARKRVTDCEAVALKMLQALNTCN